MRTLPLPVFLALLALAAAAPARAQEESEAPLGAPPADGARPQEPGTEDPRILQVRARQRLVAHQQWADRVFDKMVQALPPSARRDSLPYLGLRVADHKARENALLAEALGVKDPVRPFVYSVDPTGPAAAAGLEPGDQIVGVGDDEIRDARRFYKLTNRSNLDFPLRIRALRDGRTQDFELPASYRPRGMEMTVVGDGKNVVAFATRREIVLTTAMLNFLRNDSELAVVIGHELAHLLRGHFSSSYDVGYQPYFSQDLEKEADRYGLEYAYWAGYDPETGVNVWQRVDAELPKELSGLYITSHPPTRQRIANARKVAAELTRRVVADSLAPR